MDIAITAKLASLIDHTLLKPNGSETDHVQLCDEAKEWCFRTVCVFPQFVELCVSELNQSPTEVCTVIDFPRGLGDIEKAKTYIPIIDGYNGTYVVTEDGNSSFSELAEKAIQLYVSIKK